MIDAIGTSKGRCAFLAGTSVLASGAMLRAAAAEAKPSRYAQSLRLLAEGNARAEWVLSLLPVPAPPSEIPVRARYRFPAIEAGHAGQDVLSVRVFIQRGTYEFAISAFLVAVEHVAVAQAAFGGDDNPEHSLSLSGRVIAVDPEAIQPFGDLVGRTFAVGCGFLRDDAPHSAATFRCSTVWRRAATSRCSPTRRASSRSTGPGIRPDGLGAGHVRQTPRRSRHTCTGRT